MLARCSPYRRGWGKAQQRGQKGAQPSKLHGAEDEKTGEGSSVHRGAVLSRPWALVPRRVVKKRGEHTSVVFASC